MEPTWKHVDVFPVVARVIEATYREHQSFVSAREIATRLLHDPEGRNMVEAAQILRFSSGYSVETFLFLDLLSHAFNTGEESHPRRVILQQYQAQSPHFHEKGDEEHIKRMISDSLGSFYYFREQFSPGLRRRIQRTYKEMELEVRIPTVYPSLRELAVEQDETFANQYRLSERRLVFAGQEDLCG